MLDDAKRAEIEQAVAAIGECLPAMWWGLFQGSLEVGFPAAIALDLTKTYILGQAAGSIVPPPSTDEKHGE